MVNVPSDRSLHPERRGNPCLTLRDYENCRGNSSSAKVPLQENCYSQSAGLQISGDVAGRETTMREGFADRHSDAEECFGLRKCQRNAGCAECLRSIPTGGSGISGTEKEGEPDHFFHRKFRVPADCAGLAIKRTLRGRRAGCSVHHSGRP